MNKIVEKKYFCNKSVLNVSLNKDSVNSINNKMLDELVKVLHQVKSENTRCLIISTKGNNFCAGADLKERQKLSKIETVDFLDKLNSFLKDLENLNIVTIAAIKGACLGGGLEIALACDFRVSSETGLFGFPETSLGIIPGAGGTQRMVKLFGVSTSMKWIFSADRYNADHALNDRIIDYLVDLNKLDDFCVTLAKKIIKNSPVALKAAKKSILSGQFETSLNVEKEQYIKTLNSDDRDEGLLSFKEKRPPIWKNK
tara:strand:+ start:200 stop:967 length:768 start_codon:yes stop_codon:yes gene_type:complete